MAQNNMFIFSLLLTLAGLHAAHAVDYEVTNNAGSSPGAVRFNNDIGADYSKQTLISAADFIWKVFQQSTDADRKSVAKLSLFIDNLEVCPSNSGATVACASNNEIHVGASYIADYPGDVKKEITGVLYHESTHVWQWFGNAPTGLTEGIADFVRLRAGYIPSHWVQPGEGDKWDHGYDVTARFLDYCTSLKDGFVAELNSKLKTGYSVDYFSDILGKNVDQLWADYKAKYGK